MANSPQNDLTPVYQAAAKEWNVDPALLQSVAGIESGGTPNPDQALSPKGAQGRMQLMPGTAQQMGVSDPSDPVQNIYGGAKYLSQMLDKYQSPELALAAYNAGPDRVDAYRAGKAPLPDQTTAYIQKVGQRYQTFAAPQPGAPAASPVQQPAADPFSAALGGAQNQAPSSPPVAKAADPFTAALTEAQNTPLPVTVPAPSSYQTVDPHPAPDGSGQMTNLSDADYAKFMMSGGIPGAHQTAAAVGNIASAAGNAAVQAFGQEPLGIGPQSEAFLAKMGVVPNPQTGQGTTLQQINDRFLIRPVATVGDALARGAGALFSGAQAGVAQAGTEIGNPDLGRDLAALPEAFMGMPEGAEGAPRLAEEAPPPRAPNPLSAEPPAAPTMIANPLAATQGAPSFVPPGAPVPASLIEAERARVAAQPAPSFVPPGTPKPPDLAPSVPTTVLPGAVPNPLASAPAAPVVGNPLTSGGPIGTPQAAPTLAAPIAAAAVQTPRQIAAARATSEMERLMAPAPLGRDTTQYVPGVQPTEAEVAGNADTAITQKRTSQSNPQPFTERDAENNAARTEHFDQLAGTPATVNALKEARADQATADLQTAFGNKAPTDATPVVDTIQNILTNPRDSENPAVQKYISPILNQLYDDKGVLKTDPENLYGIRESVNQQLSKASQAETPTLSHVSGQLQAIKSALDGVIEQGAPGYQQYLKNFSDASKPIDTMELLQDYKPNLTNGANRQMTFGKVDRMMKDIVTQRASGGVNAAKSIDDPTMDALFNLHADLRRANNVTLGRAAGSDTSQMLEYGKKIGLTAAHGLAAHTAPVVGNALLHFGADAVRNANLSRRTNRLLNPDMTPPNPLQSGP